MNHRYFIFLFLCSFFVSPAYSAENAKPIVCNQEYALCTSASCVPDPRHPEYAICSCVVETGDSVGFKTCAKRTPKQGKFKVKEITSTFSFKQFDTKKSMNCARGTPWTNCVDAPCTVNPMDAAKALCSCKIIHNEAFFTFGGDCDTSSCGTGFWSGANVTMGNSLRIALFDKLNIIQNPWPNNSCTAADMKKK